MSKRTIKKYGWYAVYAAIGYWAYCKYIESQKQIA